MASAPETQNAPRSVADGTRGCEGWLCGISLCPASLGSQVSQSPLLSVRLPVPVPTAPSSTLLSTAPLRPQGHLLPRSGHQQVPSPALCLLSLISKRASLRMPSHFSRAPQHPPGSSPALDLARVSLCWCRGSCSLEKRRPSANELLSQPRSRGPARQSSQPTSSGDTPRGTGWEGVHLTSLASLSARSRSRRAHAES